MVDQHVLHELLGCERHLAALYQRGKVARKGLITRVVQLLLYANLCAIFCVGRIQFLSQQTVNWVLQKFFFVIDFFRAFRR